MEDSYQTVISPEVARDLFIAEVVTLVVAISSYIIRFYFKRRRSDAFGLDDAYVTVSVLCLIADEVLIWQSKHSMITSIEASTGNSEHGELLIRTGPYMVLIWSIIASSQLSVWWFYRFVCSGFHWSKYLLTFGMILAFCGWTSFTICDGIHLAFVNQYLTPAGSGLFIKNYKAFEIASMVLTPLGSLLILGIQLARLLHVRGKLKSKPYLVLVPAVSLVVVLSGMLRLAYFLRLDLVSERIWLEVHLGSVILCASVPVYTGLEKMCCHSADDDKADIELWLSDLQSPRTNTSRRSTPRSSEDSSCDEKIIELDQYTLPSTSKVASRQSVISNWAATSMPPSRRPSDTTTWVPASAQNTRRPSVVSKGKATSDTISPLTTRRPSAASTWVNPKSRRMSTTSSNATWHGITREIVISPEAQSAQRDGAEFLPSRQASTAERATKRAVFES